MAWCLNLVSRHNLKYPICVLYIENLLDNSNLTWIHLRPCDFVDAFTAGAGDVTHLCGADRYLHVTVGGASIPATAAWGHSSTHRR